MALHWASMLCSSQILQLVPLAVPHLDTPPLLDSQSVFEYERQSYHRYLQVVVLHCLFLLTKSCVRRSGDTRCSQPFLY
uniref:Putative secreted protein n=1 Tax=Xenopsylla cheopis TaxID=163159 RepID=A0A6M2E0Y6_XENCH